MKRVEGWLEVSGQGRDLNAWPRRWTWRRTEHSPGSQEALVPVLTLVGTPEQVSCLGLLGCS